VQYWRAIIRGNVDRSNDFLFPTWTKLTMAEPSLSNVFGANATQDINTVTIAKVDLAAVGLTADSANTAESLLVAILLLAKQYLTPANLAINEEQAVTVVNGFDTVVPRINAQNEVTSYEQRVLSVNMLKLATGTIDPDDY